MERNDQQWEELCRQVKDLVPQELGEEAWYLVIAAALGVSPVPSAPAEFYTYLTKHDPAFSSGKSREYLSQRLRDVILKLLTIVGGPQVLSVLIPLAVAEGDIKSRAASSKLSEKWFNTFISPLLVRSANKALLLIRIADEMSVPALYERGQATINTIYGAPLLEKVFDSLGSHREDVKFNEIYTLYGLFLSDFEVLTPLETEAVVYSSISCLGLGGPGNWHLRGMGRLLGARGTDDQSEKMKKIMALLMNLKQAVVTVVEFVGDEFKARAHLHKWADPATVAENLGGWGNDD
ncbi:hypothetical protein N7523_003429 [Penicillium sp. IBT 18751x]|nr:hypothetical protein N7523_003429 [Penicillium sp. IBT 18751x]